MNRTNELQNVVIAFDRLGWIACSVVAVIVVNPIALHPVQAVGRALVDCLVVCTRGSIRAALASLHRAASAYNASIQGPVSVGGNKRSVVPVDFHTPALRRPGASVPDTAVYSHGLLIWVWEARAGLDILECADGCVVDVKSAYFQSEHDMNPSDT